MNFFEIKKALAGTTLFAEKTWKIGAEFFSFPSEKIEELRNIGNACFAFYKALETLYARSAENKNLLRNETLFAPFAAEILERGKPKNLIAHQRSRAIAGTIPPVIRPDLLITENGFALTELDSVPGGIGLTAFLAKIYKVENPQNSIAELFWKSISRGNENAKIAIAVSEEASTYFPEFNWLSAEIRERFNAKIFVTKAENLEVRGNEVFAFDEENRRSRVDVLYRFFELFDLKNFHFGNALLSAAEAGKIEILPPMKSFQEEKISLALFQIPALENFWRENLGNKNFEILKKIVPETWILEEPKNLSAGTILLGPKPLRSWREIENFSARERDLILKVSGFSPDCWGARSVSLGNDMSREAWKNAVENAISRGEKGELFVLQKFKKPKKFPFRIFDDLGNPASNLCRARICPFYFVRPEKNLGNENRLGNDENLGNVELGGALATLCPADKKIIHGMSSASLVPVKI